MSATTEILVTALGGLSTFSAALLANLSRWRRRRTKPRSVRITDTVGRQWEINAEALEDPEGLGRLIARFLEDDQQSAHADPVQRDDAPGVATRPRGNEEKANADGTNKPESTD